MFNTLKGIVTNVVSGVSLIPQFLISNFEFLIIFDGKAAQRVRNFNIAILAQEYFQICQLFE
jgi:hypothetical protein